MIGTIEATNKSQSGKTLGVKIGETWYTSKNWELENMVNQSIDFEPSSSNFNGKVMWWINDYVAANAPPTADQAFNQAHANYTPPQPGTGGPPPMGSPQPPQMAPQAPQSAPAPQTAQTSTKDRDSFIAAQALCKTLTFQSAKDALDAFKYLYIQLRDWNPETDVPYDSDIPY